jgi:CHAD domain-containing protein
VSTIQGVSENFTVAYYEAGNRRLARAGATLSRRLDNGQAIWRLDLPRFGGERLELEQLGGPELPPERITRALPAFLRGSEPEPVVRLQVTSDNGSSRARVLEGLRAGELGAPDGNLDDRLVELIRDGEDFARDPIGRLRAMLARQYAEILRHDPGVRLDLHPEDVHRVRVAVRRTRAVLRAARPLLDREWSEPLRAELKWLGGSLGPRRDLDVLVKRVRGQVAQLEPAEREAAVVLVESLEREREDVLAVALEALSTPRYFRLLDELEAAARGPRVTRGDIPLSKLARREFSGLRKKVTRLGPATDADLHRARILGKRARYAAELAGPELGKRGRRLIERAAELQDVLGAHQDAIVAEARLRELLADVVSTGAAFAAGRLVEQERARRAEARAALPKAWRKLERAGERAWA